MKWAERYLGIPYLEEGRTRDGVDCWGLVRLVTLDQTGVEHPLHSEIKSQDRVRIFKAMTKGSSESLPWEKIPAGDEQSFDMVVMLAIFQGKAHPLHVGIVTSPGFVLHIEEGREVMHVPFRTVPGVCRADPNFANRVVGIYRHEAFA